MGEALGWIGCLAVTLGAASLACGKPPMFPAGGVVKATGYCELSLDFPKDDTESYGYDFNGYGLVGTLFFEGGALTHLKFLQTPSLANEPDQIRHRPSVPAYSSRGQLPAPIVEGQWYQVSVEALNRDSPAGERETARIRFRGAVLDVAFEGRVAQADCAWQ